MTTDRPVDDDDDDNDPLEPKKPDSDWMNFTKGAPSKQNPHYFWATSKVGCV